MFLRLLFNVKRVVKSMNKLSIHIYGILPFVYIQLVMEKLYLLVADYSVIDPVFLSTQTIQLAYLRNVF